MDLRLSDDQLAIVLDGLEQLWAAHLGKTIYISIDHMAEVAVGLPEGVWDGIRAPGTFVPGVIRAGTYYTTRGREFWYVTRQGGGLAEAPALTLDLTQDSYYKRIVLTVADCAMWGDRLQQRINSRESRDNQ